MLELHEQLEERNLQHAMKGDVVTSLRDNLRNFTKTRLSELASIYKVPGRSKMKKEELANELLEYMIKTEMLESILLYTNPDELKLVESLLEQAVMQNNNIAYRDFYYLYERGLVFTYFTGGNLYLVMPDEIRNTMATLITSVFKNEWNRCHIVHKYILALTNLYGAFKLDKLIEIYNAQNDTPLNEKEIIHYLLSFHKRDSMFDVYKGYIVDEHLASDEGKLEFEDLIETMKYKPYYIPNKNVLLRYADDSYSEMTPQLMRLRNYILQYLCPDRGIVDDLVDDIQLACSMESSMQDIIYEFERRHIDFESMEQVQAIVPLLGEVHNHTRLWINGGHTPNELASMEFNKVRPINTPFNAQTNTLFNVMTNKSAVTSTKIGRNEPCPCGSGLKHKKCCGK